MNILILDFTLSKTHIRLNISNFAVLSKNHHLYIMNSNNYYDEFAQGNDNVTLIETGIITNQETRNSFVARGKIIKNMLKNKKAMKKGCKGKIDAVIVMGFEVITFALFPFMFRFNAPVYLFQHQQLDELENGVKYFFFKTYKNKVCHIVYETQFEEYMKQKLRAMNVYTIHYIPYTSKTDTQKKEGKWIVGLSSHNDEQIVRQIVENQESTKFLDNCNTHVYIRSKTISYKDEFLEVGYQYLSSEEYDNLYNISFAILAPIPLYFHNRVSGPVIDGITSGKIVLCSNQQTVSIYKDKAPSLVRYFEGATDFVRLVEQDSWEIKKEDLDTVRDIYNPRSVLSEYEDMFAKQ